MIKSVVLNLPDRINWRLDMKKAIIILAPLFEEIEAITPIDLLRRAEIDLTVASIYETEVKSARNLKVIADTRLAEVKQDIFDIVIIPGGKGAWTIAEDSFACKFILEHNKNGKIIAAICAAPAIVLGKSCKILDGKHFTCFAGLESEVPAGIYTGKKVEIDGNIITGSAPSSAFAFSLAIIDKVLGTEKANQIKKSTLCDEL